jgi:enoyl-CoA hydratase
MADQAVRVERSGPVTTVLLHRPARRNAVDGPTAAQLAAAFRAFEADHDAAVAVLHGEGGVFCSGADLTAIGTERGNRAAPDGDGPMGVSRLRLSKPVIAAVSSWHCGATCGWRTRRRCSASSAAAGASRSSTGAPSGCPG